MLPFTYIFRNLLRRPLQTIQLLAGSGLVVLLIMIAAATNQAMENTLISSGDSKNVILLGAGSEESVERSEVASGVVDIISSSVTSIDHFIGEPAVSPEVHYNGMIGLPNGDEAQALIRGVRHQSTWVYPKLRILQGHFPRSGEVMVGILAHQKLGISPDQLTLGKEVRFNDQSFIVSGIFSANGTVMEAEMWIPLQDLMTATQRDNLSCVVLRMIEVNGFSDVEIFAKTRLDLELVGIQESEYYNSLSAFYRPIRWMSWVCAVLLAVGAILGGLNSLHAAFSERIREFGAMQAIGFSRGFLLCSLIQESTIYCLLGSCLAFSMVALWLQGISFPFSIGVFVLNFDFAVFQVGLFTCFGLGLIGGLPPGWKCLRPTLPQTLRAS